MERGNIAEILLRIRRKRPIVYNFANIVTANECANVTLAVGASPVMGLELEEDLIATADALVINIGTATKSIADILESAASVAIDNNIPIVLDPVGAGASKFRTDLSVRIIEKCHPIIRCNYSEFLALAGIRSETRGVDSNQNDFFDEERISSLAHALGTIIAVTGHHDVISDGTKTVILHNGNPKMEDISGTGCMCSSLVGATTAVAASHEDLFTCVVSAIAIMGICGEKSAENFRGTSQMKSDIIDYISTMEPDELLSRLRFEF